MKSKKRYAALLAAFILSLGLIALPRVGAAGGNDDLEFLQPPGTSESGDPDGPPQVLIVSLRLQITEVLNSLRSTVVNARILMMKRSLASQDHGVRSASLSNVRKNEQRR